MPRKKYYYETGGDTIMQLTPEQMRQVIFKGIDKWEKDNKTNIDKKIVAPNNRFMKREDIAETLYSIARMESSFDPQATGEETSIGNRSHGLFQLNDVHFKEGGLLSYTDPQSLLTGKEEAQVSAALDIAVAHNSFTPWATYRLAQGDNPYSNEPKAQEYMSRSRNRNKAARQQWSSLFEDPNPIGSYEDAFTPRMTRRQ